MKKGTGFLLEAKMKAISIETIAKAVGGTILAGDGATEVTSVSTNSKEIKEGALFVPIIGERVDAHKFINAALEAGAVATFTSKEIEEFVPGKVYIKVEDTIVALQRAATYYRSLFSVKIIGITGSVGKTTTKEMIAAALETKLNVLKTKGNMNSQIGLPLMMFYLEEDTEVAVIEMGMSEVGEMSRLAAVAKPEIAVITNIGVSHIGQLGSKENIRKEKMNIINQFVGDNKVFVNGNDVLLQELKGVVQDTKDGKYPKEELFDADTAEKLKVITVEEFGTEEHCEYVAKEMKNVGEEMEFLYSSANYTEKITLSVLGLHNVNNALVALAIAEQLGIKPSVAKKGLKKYAPIAMRGQIYENKGMKIIDDTYNASPDSMKSGVAMLLEMDGLERRIVVLADVLELGEVSRDCHYGVGAYIAEANNSGKKVDILVTVGTEAKAICEGVTDKNTGIITKAFTEKERAIAYLKQNVKLGDGIIVKGSRGMHMEEVVSALKEME